MNLTQEIDVFIEALAAHEAPPAVFNPYSYTHAANATRRANLRLYLRERGVERPLILLVGEAPGYRGCRLTGVPFTSEAILLDGTAFGQTRGYRKTGETDRPTREATATIVWEQLGTHACTPLVWNAFPFHPHRPGEPWSNRTPRRTEIARGEPFLHRLLAMFAPQCVVAVGNKARTALTAWSIDHHHVRHPSHGGKQEFSADLTALLEARGHAEDRPRSTDNSGQ